MQEIFRNEKLETRNVRKMRSVRNKKRGNEEMRNVGNKERQK